MDSTRFRLDRLRSKRIAIPTVAVVAVLGAGGAAWTATASGDDGELTGADLDRASSAAVEAAGGGRVTGSEVADDAGAAYEVEVTRDDGTEVDVLLADDFSVVREDTEDTDADGDADGDERAVTDQQRAAAERAATEAVGGGDAVDVEADDDTGAAYEVEVVLDGAEWTVTLDDSFGLVDKRQDD